MPRRYLGNDIRPRPVSDECANVLQNRVVPRKINKSFVSIEIYRAEDFFLPYRIGK